MASILVVDDEPSIGDALRRVLESEGFTVSTAASATEALDAMAVQPADIVITDVIMPRINGLELIARLRGEYPRTRIIAISGGGSVTRALYKPQAITTQAFLAAARKSGAQEVLTKPFDLDDLLASVRRLLPN